MAFGNLESVAAMGMLPSLVGARACTAVGMCDAQTADARDADASPPLPPIFPLAIVLLPVGHRGVLVKFTLALHFLQLDAATERLRLVRRTALGDKPLSWPRRKPRFLRFRFVGSDRNRCDPSPTEGETNTEGLGRNPVDGVGCAPASRST